MEINSLELYKNSKLEGRFHFKHNTLIYSEKNSKGKTSLIKLILYGLLFPVSSTPKFNFNEYIVILKIINNERKIVIERSPNKKAKIIFEDGSYLNFDLTSKKEHDNALSNIFGIENIEILSNLLGCFYIDQDIGWGVINKGLVAKPSISFSIDEFLGNLSHSDELGKLKLQIKDIDAEINKYSAIKDIYEYKKSGNFLNDQIPTETVLNDLFNQKAKIESRLDSEMKILKAVENSLHSDEAFKSMIQNMKLIISHDNQDKFILSVNDISGFEEQYDMLRAKYFDLSHSVKILKNELSIINKKISDREKPISVKTLSDDFISKVPSIDSFDQVDITGIIDQLKSQKKSLKKQIDNIVRNETVNQTKLQNYILEYTKDLRVDEIYLSNSKGILNTREHLMWSGSILNRITLAFRCAYCRLVKELYGIALPLVIDSPGASEMSEENIELMCNMLFEKFSYHQIIISSIYPSISKMNNFTKKIQLTSMLLDYKEQSIGDNDE